jgi:FixJ family two-component response regulator
MPATGCGGAIALIDDDLGVRRGLSRLLRSAAFTVVTFESAEAFLEAAAGGLQPACIVVDVHLSGMSGLELQDYLRTMGITWPAIFISARQEALPPERVDCAGTIALLTKPVSEVALVSTLGRLRRSRATVEDRSASVD